MIHTISINKARENLEKLVENVSQKQERYIITVSDSSAAVLISFAEYEVWKNE